MAKAKTKETESTTSETTTPTQPTAAELSAKLAAMLNPPPSPQNDAPVAVPPKKIASKSNFTGDLVLLLADGRNLTVAVKTFVAAEADKFSRSKFHIGTPIMEDVMDEDGKPTGEKRQVMEFVLGEDGKPTGEEHPKVKPCNGSIKNGSTYCGTCGMDTNASDIYMGVKVKDKIVPISDEEIAAQKPRRDGLMQILEYVDEEALVDNLVYLEDTEFVAAEDKDNVVFRTFEEGMRLGKKGAKGVRIKNGREQYFILRPYKTHGMTLHYLFADYEVRECHMWSTEPAPTEMAQMWAKVMEAPKVHSNEFHPAAMDQYLANCKRLLESKSNNTAVVVPQPQQPKSENGNLLDLLNASLNSVTDKAAA
jgi:non-homologous end joining protein Ku